MIFDTHTHYDDPIFDADRDAVIRSLPDMNVGRIVNAGSTLRGARMSVGFADTYTHVRAAVGIHPDELYDLYVGTGGRPEGGDRVSEEIAADIERAFAAGERYDEPFFEEVKALAARDLVLAVGEIGLDYHGYDRYAVKPSKELQKYWFSRQLELAMALGLPVVVHSRNASKDTLTMLREARAAGLCCADIHCYSYSVETALEYIDMGFYIGIGGALTFPGAKKLIRVLEKVPMERVLLETDCPYMTPVPMKAADRFVRNVSYYLSYVVQRIAEIRGLSTDEVEGITWENACRFYGLV